MQTGVCALECAKGRFKIIGGVPESRVLYIKQGMAHTVWTYVFCQNALSIAPFCKHSSPGCIVA